MNDGHDLPRVLFRSVSNCCKFIRFGGSLFITEISQPDLFESFSKETCGDSKFKTINSRFGWVFYGGICSRKKTCVYFSSEMPSHLLCFCVKKCESRRSEWSFSSVCFPDQNIAQFRFSWGLPDKFLPKGCLCWETLVGLRSKLDINPIKVSCTARLGQEKS